MLQMFKVFVMAGLLTASSLVIAAGVATGFIYPVSDTTSNIPPTEQGGNGNAFHIAQNFNTSYIYGGSASSPNGGWCGTSGLSAVSGYISKTACESAGYKWIYGHTGVDLSDYGCNSLVKATANGIIEYSSNLNGYGYLVKIRHLLPNGRYVYSLYGHLNSIKSFPNFPNISKGDLVGTVGDTVNIQQNQNPPINIRSGFCHLHFAIFDQDMPLNGAVVPVGYLYDDKGFTTSGGAIVSPNILRYFYDPLLFVNDRNSEQQTFFPGSGSWGLSFSTTQSVTSRTMYLVNGMNTKSLQDGVSAGWIGSQLQHLTSSNTWEYLPIVPMDSYTFLAANTYAMYSSGPGTYVHWFIPGNTYLDARFRGDMTEFTKVNVSLGFGRGMRETYGNNPNWDPNYGLAMMGYEFNGPSTFATVQIAYLKSDPLTRFVCYLNNQTNIWSAWVQVH
jgi:murein DD-endopeptidase MepM/ murein hydrolase activator NlpD